MSYVALPLFALRHVPRGFSKVRLLQDLDGCSSGSRPECLPYGVRAPSHTAISRIKVASVEIGTILPPCQNTQPSPEADETRTKNHGKMAGCF